MDPDAFDGYAHDRLAAVRSGSRVSGLAEAAGSDVCAFDLLKLPILGAFFGWRHARTVLQIPVLLISLAMIVDGFWGPTLSPKNLATTLTWIHFRGLLVLVLLAAGNFFCLACPFVLVRDVGRKLQALFHWGPRLQWPRRLRNKWLSIALFGGVLFSYEAFSLWASPWWTACLIAGYFLAIVAVDLTFQHATFCKFVCPIGQFNFVASTLSPLEVKVRRQSVCDTCQTKDCIRGRRSEAGSAARLVTIQRGCELALFQPRKIGNLDCTFCLDCVHACPHDNVGIGSRVPGEELLDDGLRSGIGHLSKRKDLSALALLFLFGALMNAFGMVSPVYAFEHWLNGYLRLSSQTALLGVVFTGVVVLEPALLLTASAALSRTWSGSGQTLLTHMVNNSYALMPLGFGMWLAHYGFHFLTGLYTVIPLAQNAVLTVAGTPLLGVPVWTLVGLPARYVQPIEYGFLALGWMGALVLLQQRAESDTPRRWVQAVVPWALLATLLFGAACWVMAQPMEMRATFLA